MDLLKNTLKLFFRRRGLLFWTFLFPIVLSTLFYVAIKPAYENTVLEEPIAVAVVSEGSKESYDTFINLLESLEFEEDVKLVDAQSLSYDDAVSKLDAKEIKAIYVVKDEISIEATKFDTSVYVLESVATSYNQQQELFMKAVHTNGIESAIATFQEGFSVTTSEISLENNDTMSMQYYTVFGMSCFYCAFWGLQTSYDSEGNQSAVGARKMVAPTSKFKVLLCDYILCFAVSFISQIIVFAYMHFILGMQIGNYGAWMLLLIALGTLAGISWGKVISTALKCSNELKNGIVTMLPLVGSGLSGMMGIVVRRLPIAQALNLFNPMNWINEGMYSLYVYGLNSAYMRNLLCLVIFTLVAFIFSIILGRRKQYESI